MGTMLQLTGYLDDNLQKPIKGAEFICMINPSLIQRNQEFEKSGEPNLANSHNFSDLISFELVLDCTGIVDPDRTEMVEEITRLDQVLFLKKKGEKRPNFIHLQWSKNLDLTVKIKKYCLAYTLFKPDGTPLRAKILLEFEV